MTRIFKPIEDLRKEKRKARVMTRAKIALLVAILLALFYILVSFSGHWLVNDVPFQHVKWVVILDGQSGDLERWILRQNLSVKAKQIPFSFWDVAYSAIKATRIFTPKI